MDINRSISQKILSLHDDMQKDPYHRFRSWEHCYKFFQHPPNDYDLASLNLGFYLASWGMFRGSSFLLQKDYKIHLTPLREILSPKYAILRNLTFNDLESNSDAITNKVLELTSWLRTWYRENIKTEKRVANVTDTLATKILLGTLGCTPAYDRYFIAGLKRHGLSYSYLNKKNFGSMIDFCLRHKKGFEAAQTAVSRNNIQYPIMKIVDMYFWQHGQ